ncbi:MAG: hypothetical protein OHK0056_24200 [Bacteriovoracaceae bacterium]
MILIALFFGQVFAQSKLEMGEKAWNLKVGAGVHVRTNFRKDNKAQYYKGDPIVLPLPYARLKMDRLEIEPDRARWSFFKNMLFALDARVQYLGYTYQADGMAVRHKSLFAGAGMRILLFKLDWVKDVTDKSRGAYYSAELIIPIPYGKGHLSTLSAEIEFWDRNGVDYYFGVKEEEATADRPAYNPTRERIYHYRWINYIQLSKNWLMRIVPEYRYFGDRIKYSPTVAKREEFAFTMGIVYDF